MAYLVEEVCLVDLVYRVRLVGLVCAIG